MRLSKALKRKNALGRDIYTLQTRARKHNVVVEGNKRAYSVREIIEELESKTNELVELKTAIAKANEKIQSKIFRMNEIRIMISFYSSLDTKEGRSGSRFDTELVYTAEMGELELDAKIDELKKELENIQDDIDAHNMTTQI
jgi:hypothetical protein